MTEKQKRAIVFIEKMLEIKYTGDSDADAWQFIHDNIEFARKCAYIESNLPPVTVYSVRLDDAEPDINLKCDISRELLFRDSRRGKSGVECMTNFCRNLFVENVGRSDADGNL